MLPCIHDWLIWKNTHLIKEQFTFIYVKNNQKICTYIWITSEVVIQGAIQQWRYSIDDGWLCWWRCFFSLNIAVCPIKTLLPGVHCRHWFAGWKPSSSVKYCRDLKSGQGEISRCIGGHQLTFQSEGRHTQRKIFQIIWQHAGKYLGCLLSCCFQILFIVGFKYVIFSTFFALLLFFLTILNRYNI